jgi:RNA polymerase sigma-70 factor (ECF subfamily)
MSAFDPEAELAQVLASFRERGAEALAAFFERHRERLERVVKLRMDRRVQGRIDPADVVQETYLEAAARLPEYLADSNLTPYLWARFLTLQKLLQVHRRHLGAQARDAGREISLYGRAYPEATSAALAAQLVGKLTSPSQAAMRAETKLLLQEALNGMDPLDREILALRHFEQLTAADAARVLDIDESASSKRYLRAIKRLGAILRKPGRDAPAVKP